MIHIRNNERKYAIGFLTAALILYSALGIDYSGLGTFSLSMGTGHFSMTEAEKT